MRSDPVPVADAVTGNRTYDASGKYTTAAGSFSEITGATGNYKVCTEFANHLFFAGHSVKGEVVFTAPNTDDDFAPGNGAGSFNVGDEVMFLIAWRDQLVGRDQEVVGAVFLDHHLGALAVVVHAHDMETGRAANRRRELPGAQVADGLGELARHGVEVAPAEPPALQGILAHVLEDHGVRGVVSVVFVGTTAPTAWSFWLSLAWSATIFTGDSLLDVVARRATAWFPGVLELHASRKKLTGVGDLPGKCPVERATCQP